MVRIRLSPHAARVTVVAAVAAAVACAPGPAAAASGDAAALGQAELFAGRLAEDPVYVSDHMAGGDLPATREAMAAAVAPLDVPVFVIAAPAPGGDYSKEPLLAAVHDRLGEDGLYLSVTGGGSALNVTGVAYGVHVPGLADSVAEADLHQSCTAPVTCIERAVGNISSGEAAGRLDATRERIERDAALYEATASPDPAGSAWSDLADDLDPDSVVGRNNIGFSAGILIGATLAIAAYCARRALRRAAGRLLPGGPR
ncbi:hypothetical protein ACFOVU_13950 [Nocardiopsis sediminis]|uniref:TPM domain-containing protein n=1 Tax=Nocardiopsis sediminis TaxID=1778267 RepID=A0ABV8FLK2_9ACTN